LGGSLSNSMRPGSWPSASPEPQPWRACAITSLGS
jgi:hypothetical protein